MKFAKYIEHHTHDDKWRNEYIRYKWLKQKLQNVLDSQDGVYIPTRLCFDTRSSMVIHEVTAQESFFVALESELNRISNFSNEAAKALRKCLAEFHSKVRNGVEISTDSQLRLEMMEEAKELGDEYLHLEKYVNINYAGLQKILKKHDKLLPSAPCWGFYKYHISGQAWVRGEHRDIQVSLARIFTELHGSFGPPSVAGIKQRQAKASPDMMVQNLDEHTRTFWVRKEDVAKVENAVMQHMHLVSPSADGVDVDVDVDDLNVCNTLYLDNASLELYHSLLFGRPYATQVMLKWKGSGTPQTVQVLRKVHKEGWRPESSTKDSFPLRENRVAEFLHGRWTFDVARSYLISQAKAMVNEAEPYTSEPSTSTSTGQGIEYTRPNRMNSQTSSIGSGMDSHLIAIEYNLFKTFTEVQRLVETKQLQPMLLMRFRQTVFQSPEESGPEESGLEGEQASTSHSSSSQLQIELDEDITALLEFSYDGSFRISNGLWRQEQYADRIECPYALIKIHYNGEPLPPGAVFPLPPWLTGLLGTGMLTEVHDFSKYLYGAAGLLPDMVRAVPVWIDDARIQRALYINVLMRDLMHDNPGSELTQAPSLPDTLSRAHSEPLMEGTAGVSYEPGEISGGTAMIEGTAGVAGWQAKLIQRQFSKGRVYKPRPSVLLYKETKQFFGNERMFLTWMTLAITVGGVGVAMLGFAASASTDPDEKPTIYICEDTALLLMACSIFICSYSILAFLNRSSKISDSQPDRYDETGGTAVLNLIVLLTLFALFWMNIADILEIMQDREGEVSPPLPPRYYPDFPMGPYEPGEADYPPAPYVPNGPEALSQGIANMLRLALDEE